MKAGRALVALAVVAAAIGGAGGLASATESDPAQEERELLDADTITVTVDVREDGAAEWAIQYKYRLDTPNRTRGFERLRERVGARERAYASDVRADVQQTVDLAENDTGRSMAVSNVSVDAHRQTIPQDFGVVVHRFTWRGFAATDGAELRAGDAIRGFWLRPRTELRFEWPAEYRAVELEPEPEETDEDGATWENPDFGVDEPSVVLRQESSSDWAELAAPGLLLLTVVGTLALIRHRDVVATVPGLTTPSSIQHADSQTAASAWARARSVLDRSALRRTAEPTNQSDAAADRGDGTPEHERGAPARQRESAGAVTADGAGPADGPARSDDAGPTAGARPAEGAIARDGETATSGAAASPQETDAVGERTDTSAGAASTDPSAPLSNEERLLRVLDRNDGRVKQQTVADVCDWSASKTSRVVRALEDDGVVDVFRIGRENVVSSTEDDLEDV